MHSILRLSSFAAAAALLALIGVALPARQQRAEADSAPKPQFPLVVGKCSVKLIDEVSLSAERGGTLGELNVREGDVVEAGTLVAMIKDDVPRATFAIAELEAQSEVEIKYAKAATAVAGAEYEKAVEANRRTPGTVPEVEVLRAKLAWDKAKLEIEKAEHTHAVNGKKRDEAAQQLNLCRIEAPFRGFVTRSPLTSGALVKPGDLVVELIGDQVLKVEGHVDSADAAELEDLLRKAHPKRLRVVVQIVDVKHPSGRPRKFEGSLVFVDRKVTPVENLVRIWAEAANPSDDEFALDDGPDRQLLRDGQNAVMTIYPTTTEK